MENTGIVVVFYYITLGGKKATTHLAKIIQTLKLSKITSTLVWDTHGGEQRRYQRTLRQRRLNSGKLATTSSMSLRVSPELSVVITGFSF